MLIVKVYVNHSQIDEVHVQNIGKCNNNPETTIYKIVKPSDLHDPLIYHIRENGWQSLMRAVLARICGERALATVRR